MIPWYIQKAYKKSISDAEINPLSVAFKTLVQGAIIPVLSSYLNFNCNFSTFY